MQRAPSLFTLYRLEHDLGRRRGRPEGAEGGDDDVEVGQAGPLDEGAHHDGQEDLWQVVGEVDDGLTATF